MKKVDVIFILIIKKLGSKEIFVQSQKNNLVADMGFNLGLLLGGQASA